ncbi:MULTISPECIES: glycoside hydrolase domain-containing protein [unclassified Curtobacterium]|uniref:GH92 family glycosyl hydrolase n=1 Tax=unclassified Curtobacterium TaxID=257496 RepID=UPI001FB85823|nr:MULTISPECIES: glycoside hydrolase domain-containing protein [unclassified Curtobacterium]
MWFPERTLPEGRNEPLVADLGRFWDATAFGLDIKFEDGTRLSSSARDQYGARIDADAQYDARTAWVDQWNRRTVSLDAVAGRTVTTVVATIGRRLPSPTRLLQFGGTDGTETDCTARDESATSGTSTSVDAPLTLRGWLDDVTIAQASDRPSRPIDLVSTTRGTQSSARFSRGNNAPLVGIPHGGVFGLPMTNASEARWPYSYQEHNRASDNRPTIQAFATSHIPSPWMGDRGVFQIMPSPLAHPPVDRSERALAFNHADEEDHAHRYRVLLDGGTDGTIDATMTAGEFALGWRFTFSDAGSTKTTDTGTSVSTGASIILDHHGAVRDVDIRYEGDVVVVEALLDDRLQTPPHHIHLRVAGVTGEHLSFDHTPDGVGELRGSLTVATDAPVDVLLGISTVSFEDATANLHAAGTFDAMLAHAEQLWTDELSTLSVEGATHDQLLSIYSDLYRLFLYPNRAGESALTGEPHYRSPYGEILEEPIRDQPATEIVAAAFSTTNGFWDTYRTAWPLLGLLTPDTAGELARGFVQHFIDGGWTPRWSAPGAEDVMTGTTSDTVFADLLIKGVPHIDLVQAYRSAVKNATVPARDCRVGRKGLQPGAFRGFVDVDTNEGMSWTLDAAINDWSTSVMARLLAEQSTSGSADAIRYEVEAEWFARRSLQYRNVFRVVSGSRQEKQLTPLSARDVTSDPQTNIDGLGFFVGRNADGSWRVPDAEYDPDQWGGDYTETNAWGTMFTAPHDGAGIAALHGGEDGLLRALAAFSARAETGRTAVAGHYGSPIHEMTEARDVRMGMLGLSNQPAHHIPFFPMYAGHHDDAHRTVREALDRLFVGSDFGQGYPGDEDNGEMSAWYVFGTIGLYPLAPATGTYVLIPPSVRRTELRRPEGAATVIEIGNPMADGHFGRYIESVTVDGKPWTSISIPHSVVASGTHIVFTLSDEPSGWASDTRPASASELHGFADTPADVLPVGAATGKAAVLTDDLGATEVQLAAGEAVDVPVSVEAASFYTVTVAQPGRFSWITMLMDIEGRVRSSDEQTDELFEWAGQTRAFRIQGGVRSGTFRFYAERRLALTQLELVARDSSSH